MSCYKKLLIASPITMNALYSKMHCSDVNVVDRKNKRFILKAAEKFYFL